MKSSVLPEHWLARLSPKDREAIGQSTKQEAEEISEVRGKKALQKLIYSELLRRGLFFHYSRSDRRTTTRLGTPDFGLCLNGNYIAIECKTATGKQSVDQMTVQDDIERQGGLYVIVRNFDEFLRVLKVNGL